MNLFRAAVAPLAAGRPFFAEVVVTGAHAASLAADCEGRGRYRGDRLRQLCAAREGEAGTRRGCRDDRAHPFLARLAVYREREDCRRTTGRNFAECLFETLADPAVAGALAALGIIGAEVLSPEDYARVDEIEDGAGALGYRELS